MPAFALFIPSSLDLAGWAGVIVAALAMAGLGRLVTGPFVTARATPEAALLAGWGVCVLVLTAWGLATGTSMRPAAMILGALGLLALFWLQLRLSHGEWRTIGRVAVLALPLLAIMVSARPSLPDTWLNLLPNAAYLYDHNFFPADARPDAHSFIAGAPYNMQLASYMAGLLLPDFPSSAMIDFNIVLLLMAGLLLARMMSGDDPVSPRWPLLALGILLATVLNPGFDPRYHLSAYSETSVMVALLFAGWHAARALDRLGRAQDARQDLWLLALTLAVLVNIKQESVALVFGVVATALVLAATARVRRRAAVIGIVLASLPALLLYLGWRWYVLTHFELGELKNLPFDQWHIFDLPQILMNIVRTIGSKIVFFAILAAVLAVAARRWWRREFDLATRLGAMLLGTAVIYNAALLAAYVAHFEGRMGIEAHSYFRYNTHLGLLLMGTLVMFARDWRWSHFGGSWHNAVPALLVVLVVLVPLPFLRMLRFDLEVPNLRAFQLAHEAAMRINDAEKLLVIVPGDNGTLPPTIEGVLRYLPPRRPHVDLTFASKPADVSPQLQFSRILVSCAPPDFPLVPAGQGGLLRHERDPGTADGYKSQVEATWSYPAVPTHAHWSQVLAPTPLCLTPPRR